MNSEPWTNSLDETNRIYSSLLHGNDWSIFCELIEPLRLRLHRCIGLLIGDLDEGASLVQEAFILAWEGRSKLSDGSPIYPWLRAIGINLAKQYLDRKRRRAEVRDLSSELSIEPRNQKHIGVLTAILKDELATKIWLAIGQLPDAYREAIVLHYVDGMDYAQMAEETGVGEGALRARAMRARNLLRGSLGSIVDTWMRES